MTVQTDSAAAILAGRTAAQLAARIAAEVERLDACGMSAPFGGWRSEAVRHVADMLDLNPYALDRFVRRAATRQASSEGHPCGRREECERGLKFGHGLRCMIRGMLAAHDWPRWRMGRRSEMGAAATHTHHPCPEPDCPGAECYAGEIDGCGHPTKTAAKDDRCPWGRWPCVEADARLRAAMADRLEPRR